jgi:integrase
MQAKISKRTVDATTAADREVWVWDSEVKGFGLRVRPNGRKVYVVEYRPGDGGRGAPKRRYTIGQHGSPWTPDKARAEAIRVLGQVKSGKDPASERSARRDQGDTVMNLSARFIEAMKRKRRRSWAETERVFAKDINPAIGSKDVGTVTRQDIVRLRDRVAKRGPIMSNRTLAYLRRFFNWCREEGLIAASPCDGVKPVGEVKSRARTLSDDELVEVWSAAEGQGKPWGAIVQLLLLTAQRRAEVCQMTWDEIDLERSVWTIPGERAKNNEPHEVPLTESAVKILKDIEQIAGCPYVFTTNGRTPVSGLSKAKLTLDQRIHDALLKSDPDAAPLPPWTYHDLRRTATTGMARLGVPPHIADAILNHKQGTIRGVAAIYNRHAYTEERRRALETWEKYVLRLVEGHNLDGNVVQIREGLSSPS